MHSSVTREVEAVCAPDLSVLDQDGLQALASELRGCIGRLQGRLDQVLAELDTRFLGRVRFSGDVGGDAETQSVHSWWRDAATITGQQAGRDLRRATVLRQLPLIGRSVVDGVLSLDQAAILGRLHGRIDHDALLASQAQLVDVAKDLAPDALARFVRHLIATHCEPALDADQARAHERRFLQLTHEPDGTVRGRFVLAAEDAEAVLSVLEPLARRQGLSDSRSAGQRRADALVEVFTGASAWMDLPDAGGHRPSLNYVITEPWSAGHPLPALGEQLAVQGLHPHALTRTAADAAWTGPQTRPRIEALLCDARLNRLILDTHGTVISLQAVKDQITPAQRRAVAARDRQCLARGCTRPPAFCDVHHLTARADGGPTVVENLGLLCRRHHVLWHRGKLALHDLYVPWLDDTAQADTRDDPWDGHSPPIVA